ncbi:MAG: DUF1572 family protein [Planctomycetota bacterium]
MSTEARIIESWREIFAKQKDRAERAMAQLSDAELHEPPAPSVNAVSVIIRHMAGGMRSRWTDWLTTDGEKPGRDRESEFAVDPSIPRAQLMEAWEGGWSLVLGAMAALTPGDLARTITIRGEPHSVPRAVTRQIDHYGYHSGQIVTFAKMLVLRAGREWTHLSVPPGGTSAFNAGMRERFGSF